MRPVEQHLCMITPRGAALILEAAIRLGNKVKMLVLYEAPFNNDPAAQYAWTKYLEALGRRLEQVAGETLLPCS